MQIDYFELLISLILASFGGLVKRMTDLEKKPEKNFIYEGKGRSNR